MKKPQILLLLFLCLSFFTQAQKSLFQNFNLGVGKAPDLSGAEEDLSVRDEYTACFRFPDGRVLTKNSFSPIHFKNENGEWQRITQAFQRVHIIKENNIFKC